MTLSAIAIRRPVFAWMLMFALMFFGAICFLQLGVSELPEATPPQLTIEADLRRVAQGSLDLSDDELGWRCEQCVRNHDPCISCAAHFLDITVVRA